MDRSRKRVLGIGNSVLEGWENKIVLAGSEK